MAVVTRGTEVMAEGCIRCNEDYVTHAILWIWHVGAVHVQSRHAMCLGYRSLAAASSASGGGST
jgi:hypothetical protein